MVLAEFLVGNRIQSNEEKLWKTLILISRVIFAFLGEKAKTSSQIKTLTVFENKEIYLSVLVIPTTETGSCK